MAARRDRDLERTYPRAQFVAKLRRFADALEEGKAFTIQVAGERLRADLHAGRAAALEEGGVDPEWVRRTVRWIVEWTPETELPLVAALGAIARASPRASDA